MTHAGTMDLGGSAQTKQSGSLRPAIALTVAAIIAAAAGVWLASSAGLGGSTAAKPVADRSYDRIEAQRGASAAAVAGAAVTLPPSLTSGTFHATPPAGGAVAVPPSLTSGTFHATPPAGGAVAGPPSLTSGTFHASPFAGGATAVPPSATSGTFHAGTDAQMTQGKRDRIGGP